MGVSGGVSLRMSGNRLMYERIVALYGTQVHVTSSTRLVAFERVGPLLGRTAHRLPCCVLRNSTCAEEMLMFPFQVALQG